MTWPPVIHQDVEDEVTRIGTHLLGYANVKAYGATGDGSTDDSTAIIAARDAVLNSRTGSPLTSAPQTPTLYFPPGKYKVTAPDALLPTGGNLIVGYRIEGSGPETTKILFQPSGGSSTLTNMNLITAVGASAPRLIGLRIKNICFESGNVNASFAYLYSDVGAYIQDTIFEDVRFAGTWKRIIGLDGSSTANLNSEMTFNRINTGGTEPATFSDAFLHSGITTPGSNPQQDQFLNYWIRDCKFEHVSGDLFVFDKGGHIHVSGGSYIFGGGAGGTFFKMGDYSHFDSVQSLSVRDVRFELRNTSSRVIDCAWRSGNVTFENCDDEAHGFLYQINGTGAGIANYDTHIYRTPDNSGPIVRYQDCALMGYHRVVTTSTVPIVFKLIYDGCAFKNMQTGLASLLSTATNQFLRYDSAVPHYRYVDCRFTTDVNA